MEDRKFAVLLGAIVVGTVGMFLKSAWDDSKKQAEESANPPYRWTDKNRWE